ncbi:MAG: hypothetical protein Q4B45_00775 [Coriobacteriia bacterium]|nr:hypothetical protein [Coriobacteriia bacterium]
MDDTTQRAEREEAAETPAGSGAQDPEGRAAVEGDAAAEGVSEDAATQAQETFDGSGEGNEKAISIPEPAAKAAGAAARAAMGAASTLRAGAFAMRDVRNASRQSASARSQARTIEDALETDRATLAHRNEVESGYDRIVEEQSRIVRESQARISAAQQKTAALDEEHSALVADLDELKASNASELRPYKRLVETSKGGLDDANRTLTEAKRALKVAETQAKEASERRDSQVNSASRSLDNAQARQRKVQDELKHAQATGSPSVGKLQSENVAALAAVTNAKAEVDKAMKDGQNAVENAQTHLWTQNQSVDGAKRAAQDAQGRYAAHKEDYDRRHAAAQAKEAELQERIDEKKRAIDALANELDEAQAALDEAQGLLDEANLIHSTPEETERLVRSIAGQQVDLDEANAEIEHLAESEKQLRLATRGSRLALAAAAIIALAVVVLLVISCTAR